VNLVLEMMIYSVMYGVLCLVGLSVGVASDITVYAGTSPSSATTGDGGPATSAGFMNTFEVWTDSNENGFIVDLNYNRVRYVDGATGIITTVVGTGSQGYSAVGGAGTSTPLSNPRGVTADTNGQFAYISDARHIWKYEIATGFVVPYAGSTAGGSSTGTGGQATSATLPGLVSGLWLTTDGVLFFTENSNRIVRKVAVDGIILHVAGVSGVQGSNGAGDGEVASISTSVKLKLPTGTYVESTGDVYINDLSDNRVRRIDSTGIIHTFAGGGSDTSLGIAATSFQLSGINDVKGDTKGNIFILIDNGKILHVDTTGAISEALNGFGSSKLAFWIETSTNQVYVTGTSQVFKATLPVPGPPPTSRPTVVPIPSSLPTNSPTNSPSLSPSSRPSGAPSNYPTGNPTGGPSALPTGQPSSFDTPLPSSLPTTCPTNSPSVSPSANPSTYPSGSPTTLPTCSPSVVPSVSPTNAPTVEPSSPSFVPTLAPNADDRIGINGNIIINDVHSNSLNNASLVSIQKAVTNISGNAQQVNIVSTSLLKKKGRFQVSSSSSGLYSFRVNVLFVYEMAYYPTLNSSYFAELRTEVIREAVKEGYFQNILKQIAVVRNATQLLDAVCDTVTLSSTIISSDSSSSSSSDKEEDKLNDGEIVGVVLGCFVGSIILLFVINRFHNVDGSRKGDDKEDPV
jgi:hypothetical protein